MLARDERRPVLIADQSGDQDEGDDDHRGDVAYPKVADGPHPWTRPPAPQIPEKAFASKRIADVGR